MQIGRERPDERGRVPPTAVTSSGTDAPAWARARGSSAPRGGWGARWGTLVAALCWFMGWVWRLRVWVLLQHEEEVSKAFGVRASLQQGRTALRGHRMLGPGVGPPRSRHPAPPACMWGWEGDGFWVTLPSAAEPVSARSGLCLQSWPCCWNVGGAVRGQVDLPPTSRSPPTCLWGSAELLGASKPHAALLRT